MIRDQEPLIAISLVTHNSCGKYFASAIFCKNGTGESIMYASIQNELSSIDNQIKIIEDFRRYKSSVPTYGVILLDSTLNYVLLVQGFYASKNTWGFPKGKVVNFF